MATLSEISNMNFSDSGIVNDGDSLNITAPSSPVSTPPYDFEKDASEGRVKTGRRRVIHVNPREFFEDLLASDLEMLSNYEKLYGFNLSPPDSPIETEPPTKQGSEEYKKIVYGLSDDSKEYFGTRRGRKQIQNSIVKNLNDEFEELANNNNVGESPIENETRFLDVPTYSSSLPNENGLSRNGLDRTRSNESWNRAFLPRKPIFRTRSEDAKKAGSRNDSCTIC